MSKATGRTSKATDRMRKATDRASKASDRVSQATFRARIEAVRGGGHCVVIPDEAAARTKLEYRARVRGSVAGVAHRSSLMKLDGKFYMGVHKATLEKAGVKAGDTVEIVLERDHEPLPEDTLPEELAAALAKDAALRAAWEKLAPSHRREHVKAVNDAKRAETRQARVDKTLAMLRAGKPKR